MNRRKFIQQLVSVSALPALTTPALSFGATNIWKEAVVGQSLVSAIKTGSGDYWLAAFRDGQTQLLTQLPERAHDVCFHPSQALAVVVARRPGTWAKVVNIETGQLLHDIKCKASRHMYGHAIFSPDGNFLYTTENNLENDQGLVVVRDTRDRYRVVAEYPSYGIGPHELLLGNEGETLIVANGGIKTRPEHGREKLNLEVMQPSLAYIDRQSGALLERVRPPEHLHQLSIRHMDINADQEVAIGMQYQGGKQDNVPLIATHKRGQALQFLSMPDQSLYSMKQYCGSVCYDRSGQYLAVSSPRGSKVLIFDSRTHKLIDELRCSDACGLASPAAHQFMISTGLGKLYYYNTQTAELNREANAPRQWHWDNHMNIS